MLVLCLQRMLSGLCMSTGTAFTGTLTWWPLALCFGVVNNCHGLPIVFVFESPWLYASFTLQIA